MYKVVTYVKEKYGNPIVLLSENGINCGFISSFCDIYYNISNLLNVEYFLFISVIGMDDPGEVTLPVGLHDTTRINYYKGYLSHLLKAINDGANVIGYHAWSILDNFEWLLGYSSRFGIVYVDYKNKLKRHPKMSAYFFKKLIKKNKH